MIRGAQERILSHKQQLDSIVAQDKERLQQLADEIKMGKDELYTENTTTVETLYVETKATLDKQLEAQRNFAIMEQ